MHILLTILSVIGKVLLVLLVIFLALLLILLLVPLRYQLQGKKEKGIPPNGSARVTFLFRLIDLQIRIRSKDDISGRLRVAGFRVKSFGKSDTVENSQSHKSEEEKTSEVTKPEAKISEAKISEAKTSEAKTSEAKVSEQKTSGEAAKTGKTSEVPQQNKSTSDLLNAEKPVRDGVSREQKNTSAKLASIKQSVRGKLEKKTAVVRETKKQVKVQKETFAGRVSILAQKIGDAFLYLFDTAYTLEEKTDRLEAKISRAEQTLSYWDTGRHRNAVRYIIRRLFILLKHYLPRRMKGYLHFGTGRPHLTGYAAGALSLLLPAGAGSYELIPEFYEAHLETDTIASGHIRAVHICVFVLAILCSRDCRALIRSVLRWKKKQKQIHSH